MKKALTLVLCLLVWLSVSTVVFSEGGPPIQPPPLQPPPVLPFDDDGAKSLPADGEQLQKPPKIADQPIVAKKQKQKKPEYYVIIGMYDRMLDITQHKRSWPIGDSINGCVTFHDIGQVCQ